MICTVPTCSDVLLLVHASAEYLERRFSHTSPLIQALRRRFFLGTWAPSVQIIPTKSSERGDFYWSAGAEKMMDSAVSPISAERTLADRGDVPASSGLSSSSGSGGAAAAAAADPRPMDGEGEPIRALRKPKNRAQS